MTEGTKSLLFGCHQFLLHPLFVVAAWRKLYSRWPRPWQLVCILLHDIGHLGKDYLSDPELKKIHWQLGAVLAGKLFGTHAYWFVRWHSKSSNGSTWQPSELFWADKYSRLIAPLWFRQASCLVEGFTRKQQRQWQADMRENWNNGCPKGSHQLYLEIREELTDAQDRREALL